MLLSTCTVGRVTHVGAIANLINKVGQTESVVVTCHFLVGCPKDPLVSPKNPTLTPRYKSYDLGMG